MILVLYPFSVSPVPHFEQLQGGGDHLTKTLPLRKMHHIKLSKNAKMEGEKEIRKDRIAKLRNDLYGVGRMPKLAEMYLFVERGKIRIC